MLPTCDLPMSEGGKCGRPRGHTSWSIEAGVSRGTISQYAHMVRPADYDATVAPWLMDTNR
jgi:hypothetical protein